MANLSGRSAKAALVSVFLVVTVLFAALSPAPVSAQEFSFDSVRIEGNQRIENATVLSYAQLDLGQLLTAGELNAVGQRLRESGLFSSVDLVPRGATLIIRLIELPTINLIAIEGNNRLSDEALLPLIASESRRVFSSAQAEADAAAIADAYAAAGRFAATVVPRIIRQSDNRVDLVFEVTEGRVVEIERISFVGNRVYSDRRLRRVLETKQAGFLRQLIRSDTFLADRIAFDRQLLTEFYRSRGYVDFQVLSVSPTLTRKRDAFLVAFNLREGQQFRIGDISVTSDIPEVDPALFEDEVKLRTGVVYSPSLLDRNINRLEQLATDLALSFVRVQLRVTRNDRERRLDLEFALVRGPRIFVERIDIEGNATTLDRVIRREFSVVEGDPFNPREIASAAERLRALGFFSEINAVPRQGTAENRVIVDVGVTEQPTGTLSFGASYSPESGAGAVISLSEANFLGRGQAISFSLTTSQDTNNVSGSFSEHYFLGRNVRFRSSLSVGTSDDADATFDTETVRLLESLTFPVGDYSRLETRYTLSRDTISGVDAGSSAILSGEEGSSLTSAVGYFYSFNTRNRGLDPTRGIFLRAGQELAGLGGDSEYIKTSALLMGQMNILNEDVTLTATLEGGALMMFSGASRVTDRYFANSRIMRGFQQNGFGPRDLVAANMDSLGGNYYAALKFEAQFPLGLPEEYGISGGVFYDIGSIWGLDNTDGRAGGADGLDLVDDSMHLRSAVGVSIFWTTPIGPLRFNFSEVLQSQSYDLPQSFDLTISAQF